MIFMSQSGLMDSQRQAAWEQWYLAHLHVMLTVDGIESAQRFESHSIGFSGSEVQGRIDSLPTSGFAG